MSTSSSPRVDCTEMVDLSESVYLRTSLIVNLIVTSCALPVLFWATQKLWSMKYTKLFHANFKILVQLHLCGFMLHCIGRVILHSVDLYNYTTKSDPCDMIPNIYRCFVLRLMYNAGLWITNSTAVALIIERWVATKRSVTYERDSLLYGVLVAVVQLIVAAIPLGLLYWNVSLNDDSPMYYCVAAKATVPFGPQLSAVLSITFQLVARLLFHHLHRHNQVRIAAAYDDDTAENESVQRLRTSRLTSTLSNRYQLEQNISSIACLKTFANMSSVYVLLQNACFFTLMHFASSLHHYQYYATTELNGSYPTYAILTVLVMSRSVKRVRKQADANLKHHLATPNQIYIDNFKKQIA